MYLIIYLLIFTIIVYIFIIAAIKINNPFWNLMPVYHKYDFWRYLYKTPFIFGDIIKTKYYDLLQINSLEYNELTDEDIKKIINLLKTHYLGSDNLFYTYDKSKLNSDITGCDNESIISLYKKQKYELIDGEVKITNAEDIKGCILSKKINLYINNQVFHTYLLNNICCHRDETNNQIRRNLLYTHIFNSTNMKKINTFIIKKEHELFKNVIPICVYNSLNYKINFIDKFDITNLLSIKKIEYNQLDVVNHIISILTKPNKNFDICFYPDIGNLKSMITDNIIEIYVLYYKEHALAYYIIKDTFIHNEVYDTERISLISSINNCPNNNIFFNGFYYILSNIIKKFPQKNDLSIEDNSHNKDIINIFNQYHRPHSTHQVAYYSINLFIPNTPRESTSLFSFF
jgi:hypothetical protein